MRAPLSIVSAHVSHGAGFSCCWSCHKTLLQVGTAEAMDASWQSKSRLMLAGKIKAMDFCYQRKKYEQEKDCRSLCHKHGNPAKNPSLFTGPWKNTFLALGAPFCLLILVGSARSPLDFVAVSQSCTLLSQAGGSLKSALTWMHYLNRHCPQIGAQEQEPH